MPRLAVTTPTFLPNDDIIGMKEAARILGVQRSTVIFYAARGRFPAREIDGRVFAKRADVEACKRAILSGTATAFEGPLGVSIKACSAELGAALGEEAAEIDPSLNDESDDE